MCVRNPGGGWSGGRSLASLRYRPQPPAPVFVVAPIAARKHSDRQADQPPRRCDARRGCTFCRVRRATVSTPWSDSAVLAACPCDRHWPAPLAAAVTPTWSQPRDAARPAGVGGGHRPLAQRGDRNLPTADPLPGRPVIQLLGQLATHTVALLLYPGLVMIALFGTAAESVWVRVSEGRWFRPDFPWRRPSPLLTTVALSAMLAAVQMSAAFNAAPSDERNLIIAVIALGR